LKNAKNRPTTQNRATGATLAIAKIIEIVPTEMLERLSRFALDAVGSLRIRSALYPFMWACPIIGSLFIFAAFLFKSDHTSKCSNSLWERIPVFKYQHRGTGTGSDTSTAELNITLIIGR
jgi:hypothetical protein